MLLHRLIKLEPQLFVGMRSEMLIVAEEKMQQGQKKHIKANHQRWLDKIQQSLWNLISTISYIIMPALRGGEGNNGSLIDTMTIMTTKSTTMQSSLRQPGQNPTVFYLPGLESTPVHHNNDDNGNARCSTVNCPCSRLWEKFEEKTDNTDRSRSSKQLPIGKTKIYPRMGGDIEALTNGYDIIKRELLEYLRLHSSCDTNNSNSSSNNNPFQLFDSKVYTHVSNSTSSRHTNNSQNGASYNSSNHHRQEQEQQPEWSSIYLYHRGVIQSDICQTYFPLTTNILQTQCTHSMVGSCGLGSVYFSKLGSNTKIKEHCGPTNVRWRCHLPFIVPSSSVALEDDSNCITTSVSVDDRQNERRRQSCLRVGQVGINEEYVYWKEGKPILFDDSFLHSAVHYHDVNSDVDNDNDTTDAAYDENAGASSSKSSSNNNNSSNINNIMNGARIVLIVDLWHPSLTQSDRTAFGILYPPGS
jgi:hypothetical protein